MKRTAILLFAFAFSWFSSTALLIATNHFPAKPNLLFIFSDDLRWDTIHALGDREVTMTPTNGAAFGVRRPVAAFTGGATCRPASPAFSGAANTRRAALRRKIGCVRAGTVPAVDGDKSPAESDARSSHSKAGTPLAQNHSLTP